MLHPFQLCLPPPLRIKFSLLPRQSLLLLASSLFFKSSRYLLLLDSLLAVVLNLFLLFFLVFLLDQFKGLLLEETLLLSDFISPIVQIHLC